MSNALSSTHRIRLVLGGAIAIGLLAFGGWTFKQWLASNERLQVAADELRMSQRRVADIKRWQYRPRIAALEDQEESSDGMINLANRALQSAGLPESALGRVESDDVKIPIDGTDYASRSTDIHLIAISLQQLVEYCGYLENPGDQPGDSNKGLTVRKLKLTIPNSPSASEVELWDVTLTLTQMIFSPTS